MLLPSIGIEYHPQGHSCVTHSECPEVMDPEFGEYCIVQLCRMPMIIETFV